jgi:hypothetical protein
MIVITPHQQLYGQSTEVSNSLQHQQHPNNLQWMH